MDLSARVTREFACTAACIAALLASLSPLNLTAAPPKHSIPIDTLLETIQTRSVHRKLVPWTEFEPAFRERVAKADSEEAVLNAFVDLFARMGDVHSQLIFRGRTYNHYEGVDEATANRLRPLLDAARAEAGRIDARMLDRGIAYVRIPALYVFGTEAIEGASQSIQDRVCELAASDPRGWILDLRLNLGGNMLPMLAGLAPLFGPGVVGGAADADGALINTWSIREHDLWIGDQRNTRTTRPCLAELAQAPVVVLLGPATASSGEAVAIAFKHRPRTRFIGEPTARGYTTGNDWIQITPDLVLNLATTYMADRNGAAYRTDVLPDEEIAGGYAFEDLTTDAGVRAASAWLMAPPR